jgi:hypothetical protein
MRDEADIHRGVRYQLFRPQYYYIQRTEYKKLPDLPTKDKIMLVKY